MGSFFSLGKSSNDTQENPKDALKKEEELKKVQEVQEENAKLNRDKTNLAREKDKLADQNKTLIETNQNLAAEKTELNNKITGLSTDKENLTKDKAELQKRVKELEQSQQVLENVKTDLTNENTKLKNEKTELTSKITGLSTDKENLTTTLSNAKTQAEQTSQKLNELERRHAPYQKLERLYEVFLEVKDRLNFNFVATTHSTMDLIASVLSDSKYYLESLYNRASQELSDKGEKLAELFDLLFEYIKDSKFERLKEPSAYDYSCKTLYPEQNSSQKIQRVVLRGYTYDKKIACYTIVDMGS
ncbi:hypothetical protein ACQKBF_05740 [Helicobacter pylori]